MKTYIADLYFDHLPESSSLVRATADAFGVSSAEVVEGWFIGEKIRTAYQNPLVNVVLLQNHEQSGRFPHMYGVAIEEPAGADSTSLPARFSEITRRLGVAAVMPLEFGRMHLFGPDGSDRVVIRDEENDDDVIRLSPEDQMTLERAYRAIGAVASHT